MMRSILDLKKEKSGEITTNNVLSLIVAIIGIGILIFGIAKLYGIYANNAERSAQKTLDSIVAKINALEDEDEGEFFIQGFPGAEKWYLKGFSGDDDLAPDKCLFKSCLCICDGPDCEKESISFCREIEKKEMIVKSNFGWKVECRGELHLLPNGEFCDGEEATVPIVFDFTTLSDKLFQMDIKKEKDKIEITHTTQRYEREKPTN